MADTKAVTKTAAQLGLSVATVSTVVGTYEGILTPEGSCPHCGKTYKTDKGLAAHIASKHG